MSALQLAGARLRRQQALARRAASEVVGLWARVDRQSIALSWRHALPAVLTVVSSAQAIAAAGAGPYLDDLAAEYGLPDASQGLVRAAAFAGVASDGRALDTLMFQPAIAALTALKAGRNERQAMAAGRFAVDLIVRTQVADAGRVADQVALVARPRFTGYVRMLSLPSCARCVVLAGKRYRWNAGFKRHFRCDCRHIPTSEDAAGDLRTDPKAYFKSLPREEQDKLFTAAGAQAIRDGADISRVVNASRGTYTAGGRKFTTEATTRRGINRPVRLMPEQVYLEAKGNRDEALRLLRLHGYLI